MARTINEIQAGIIAAKNADEQLSGLTSTSSTAEWRLWTWLVASAMWINEQLFEAFVKDVQTTVALLKPHTAQWYVQKARAFQYSYALPDDSDIYDVIDASAQIVTHAAVEEANNRLRLKVAKTNAGSLGPLSVSELGVFTAYMNRIKDAGVRMEVTTGEPDTFRLSVNVYYDPLIIDATGARIDGASIAPVKDAINLFINTLPFNGLFLLNKMIAALENVEGIRIIELVYCGGRYAAMPFDPITYQYEPDSGYMILDDDYFNDNVHYIPHGPLI